MRGLPKKNYPTYKRRRVKRVSGNENEFFIK